MSTEPELELGLAAFLLSHHNTAALHRAGLLSDDDRQKAAGALDELHDNLLRWANDQQEAYRSLEGVRRLADRLSAQLRGKAG